MDYIEDHSDERWKAWCVHCRVAVGEVQFTRDHLPSKTLLDRPFPDNLPTLPICHDCNNRLSLDEEYLRVFLACLLEGTCEPDELKDEKVARALRRNARLQAAMREARSPPDLFGDGGGRRWTPDLSRLLPPLIKNARGHFMYEMGEQPDGDPLRVGLSPLQDLTAERRDAFESASFGEVWPEVGSRLMQRVAETCDWSDPRPMTAWIVVQPGVYRYAIHELRAVRMVLREYLAFEAVWE